MGKFSAPLGIARIASAFINDRRKFAFIKFHTHRETALAQCILLEKGLHDRMLHVNFVRKD